MDDILPILFEKQREKAVVEYKNELFPENSGIPQDLSTIANNYREISTASSSLEKPTPMNAATTTRILNADMSVRKGKYGAYIYYKTAKMKTPSFFNIKQFKENCWDCNADTLIEWVKTTYRVI
jgi:hypothetical protein